jgi:hypothetical protein
VCELLTRRRLRVALQADRVARVSAPRQELKQRRVYLLGALSDRSLAICAVTQPKLISGLEWWALLAGDHHATAS